MPRLKFSQHLQQKFGRPDRLFTYMPHTRALCIVRSVLCLARAPPFSHYTGALAHKMPTSAHFTPTQTTGYQPIKLRDELST